MFSLRKWYLDVITSRGDVAILYAARLRWGAFRVRYASALEDTADGLHREAGTIRGVEAPRREGAELTWRSRPLGVQGSWESDGPALHRRTLAATRDGVIRWTCHLPRAHATVRIGDARYDGLGYAEHLSLTIPPWKLPFDTLRWGRHVSAGHSLVWIDWQGPEQRSWVWIDGEQRREATVTDTGVSGLAGGVTLCPGDGRDVVNRDVLASFTDLVPALTRRLAGRLAGMHELKSVEASAILRAGVRQDDGWTLREVVTW